MDNIDLKRSITFSLFDSYLSSNPLKNIEDLEDKVVILKRIYERLDKEDFMQSVFTSYE